MRNDELKEILNLLNDAGVDAVICDTPVPVSVCSVKCGLPTEIGDQSIDDYILLPKTLVGNQPEMLIPVDGDSMIGVGFEPDDRLRVRFGVECHDGDHVLAWLDNVCTVKTLFHDEEGRTWLVPQNDNYDALLVEPKNNLRLLGRVVGIDKASPRTEFRDCFKRVRHAREKMRAARKLEDWQVDIAIREIGQMVKHARQWYAVLRAMIDAGVEQPATESAFCFRVAALLPDHDHLPSARELQRMCVQSFAKPVLLWSEQNAPVTGVRYRDYVAIAQRMKELLNNQKLKLNSNALPF